MSEPNESIFFAVIRAFFVTFFRVTAWVLGVSMVFILIFSFMNEHEVTRTTHIKILPNAEGKREALGSKGPVILQLNIHGVIGTDNLTTSKISTILTESREGDLKDDRVKGVLVSINSPGGTVTDSDGIYQAIQTYKERFKVPVVAYVDGLCASGGLFVASAADKFVSSDISAIGSVGVLLSPFFNVTDLMEKVGVKSLTLSAGKDKDMLNPFRPWKEGEDASLRVLIDYYYTYFVDLLTKHRPALNREKLINEYGANVFSADVAHQFGYIDAAGFTPADALKLVVAEAKLEGQDYHVVQLEAKSWVTELVEGRSPLLTGQIRHQLMLGPETDPQLMGKFLYLYHPAATSSR